MWPENIRYSFCHSFWNVFVFFDIC